MQRHHKFHLRSSAKLSMSEKTLWEYSQSEGWFTPALHRALSGGKPTSLLQVSSRTVRARGHTVQRLSLYWRLINADGLANSPAWFAFKPWLSLLVLSHSEGCDSFAVTRDATLSGLLPLKLALLPRVAKRNPGLN